MINSLNNILGKLTIIANKNMTTVVNVNPDIRLPNNECEWANYNLKFTDFKNRQVYNSTSGQYQYSTDQYSFMLPENIQYSDVNIIDVFAEVENNLTSSPTMTIIINGNDCEVQKGSGSVICPQYFREGLNTIVNPNGYLVKLFLELEIKPANC